MAGRAKKSYRLAICGATGAVGREMIGILAERDFPVGQLRLLASERSAGELLNFRGEELSVEVLDEKSFAGMDLALFSAGGAVSKVFAPLAAEAGCVVVDNTSAFRMDPDVPLVVPEVNPEALADYGKRSIIANPNCSTIQLVVALKPLHDAVRIRRVVVSTYQSVSGAGKKGVKELEAQCLSVFSMRPIESECFPRQIAFNCLPQIGAIGDDGYSFEEKKMIQETRKILSRPDLRMSATAVRVPVFYSHSEAVNIEFEAPLSVDRAQELLSAAPGIEVIDDQSGGAYPTALEATGGDDTLVGRIRKDTSLEHGLDLWVVADNVRKGAALNAVQIAEHLIEKYL